MKFPLLSVDARIALLYAVFGCAWILFSDGLLAALGLSPAALTTLQTYKGWAYVVISAVLLYGLLHRELGLRRQAMERLQESEERHRLLFEHSLDAILLTAPDGSIYAANPAACAIFGRTEAEIQRVGRAGLVDVSDPRLASALDQRARKGHFRGDLAFVRANGVKFEGEVSSNLFRTHEGLEHTSMIIRDVTERQRLERDLRDAHNRLTHVLDSLTEAFITLDHDWRITYINREAARLNRKQPEAFLGRTHWEEWPASVGTLVENEYRKAMTQGVPTHFQHHYFVPGEYDVWLDIHAYPTSDGLAIFYRDITERRQAELALQRSEQRFAIMFRKAPFAASLARLPDGRIELVNEKFESLLGYNQAEVHGRTSLEVGLYPDPEARAQASHQVQAQGFGRDIEVRLRTKSGDERDLLVNSDYVMIGEEPHILVTAQDITQRKQAELALRESEALFSKVFHSSPIGINIFRLSTGQAFMVNEAFLRVTGYTQAEVVGRSAAELGLFPDPAVRSGWIQRLQAGEDVYNQDARICHKSGRIREVFASLCRIELNREPMVLVIMTDITERKQAEAALRESEDKFKHVFEAANVGKSITGIAGKIAVNQAFAAMLGYSRDELADKTWQALTPPEDIAAIQDVLAPLVRGEKQATRFEKRYLHKTGAVIWADVSVVLRRDTGGAPLHYITTVVDISHRRQTEEKLRESEERYRQLLNVSPVGIAVHAAGKLVFANRAGARIIGADDPESLIGKPILEVIHPAHRVAAQDRIQRMLAGEKGLYPVEDLYLRLDGSEVPVEVRAVPLTYEGLPAVQVIILDITNRKLAEAELHLSHERLAELSRQLVAAHETERRAIGRELHDQFGQMLTAMKITLDLAGQLPAAAAASRIIQAQALTDDLLNRVSRLSLELRPPMLDDLGLIPALTWQIHHFQETTGIRVTFENHAVEGRRFSGEIETTAYRIVQEALTNVARHAQARQVWLEVYLQAGWMKIEIDDDGVGFDVSSALARNRGLSGIRERVHLVGGVCQIESTPGAGTHKLIQLPVPEVAP